MQVVSNKERVLQSAHAKHDTQCCLTFFQIHNELKYEFQLFLIQNNDLL